MGDYHLFIRVGHPTFVPGRDLADIGRSIQSFQYVCCRGTPENQAFEQGVAGHAIGPVQTGVADLANGIQAVEIGTSVQVGHHPATGVVGSGHHRNRFTGNVDPQLHAAGIDGGEVFDNELRRFVADVQIDALGPEPFHLMVDGAGDDVTRRQFGTGIEAGHKACPVGQFQYTALATHRLGNQKAFGLGMIQAGRMELVELHVGHAATCAPGHGDPVAGGEIGIAGIEIDLAGTAAGKHHERGLKNRHMARVAIEYIGTQHSILTT